tara:strand:+ start:5130 stop:9500 length:4371 start_codon:yes stop_codon:yes gene_type:complete
MASKGYVDKGEEDSPVLSTSNFDPEVKKAEAALTTGKAARDAALQERELTNSTMARIKDQLRASGISVPGMTSAPVKTDAVPSSEGYVDRGEEDSIDISVEQAPAADRATIVAPTPPPSSSAQLTPPMEPEKSNVSSEGYVDTGEEDSIDTSTVKTAEPSEQREDKLQYLHPNEVAVHLNNQDDKQIDILYDKFKKGIVPTGGTSSEKTFYEQQDVDDMPVPLTGPEPDWDDVLDGTTQEDRQQVKLERKKAFIRNAYEEVYKQNLNPEARKKYVADQVKNGQTVTDYEQKLIDFGAKKYIEDIEAVTNPESELRSGKELGDGKKLSSKEAILYMLKLDGLDEEDTLYKYHEMTGGQDWLAMQKLMAAGLTAGAFYTAVTEDALNTAYESGIPQRINEFLGEGRKLFTGNVQKDMSNFHDWAFFIFLEAPEMIAPMVGSLTGRSVKAAISGVAKRIGLGKKVKLDLAPKVLNAINKGEFKERDYKAWLRWDDGKGMKSTPGSARVQTYFARLEKKEDTKRVARANAEIQQDLLKDTSDRIYEQFNVRITDEIKGRLVINPERLREAGTLSTRKAFDAGDRTTGEKILSGLGHDIVKADELAALRTGTSEIIDVMLNPEMFDQMIAVTADLRKAFPDALKTTGDKRLIDKLFDLTVDKDLLGENVPELQKILDKYNMSFENYSLAIVGSGSEAGKILNKLSQLKRLRTGDEVSEEARKASEEAQGGIRRWVMRTENIRRGLLVSQFATAMRNLSSAGIRMPLEALGNVMDTVLLEMSQSGIKAGAKAVWSGDNWKGSFRGLTYMFSNPRTAKEYTDLILEHPQLESQYKQLFTNLNEIQKLTGRGTGSVADKLYSIAEDAVSLLNKPNQMQEYLVRRSMFMGEMERLVKREWGVDLLDEVGAGKLDELMSKVDIPKGKMSFAEMAQVATKRALDVTYAKQPDVAMFKTLSTFITRNGLTVAMPFPRFMFNGMELVGQYAGGASVPLTKYVSHLISKSIKRPFKKALTLDEIKGGKTAYMDDAYVLTAKDRERISRNILGVGAIAAAYAYRTDESAPSDYKKLKADDGHIIDSSPQFPLRQMLFLGEAIKQLIDPLKGPEDRRSLVERIDTENLANWFTGDKGNIGKEFMQTFVGSSIRTGVGNGIITEIMELYSGVTGSETGLIDSERSAKTFGRLLGNYLSSWAVPLAQIVDVQRALGYRTTKKMDAAREPVVGDTGKTFMNNLTQPFRSRVGEDISAIMYPSKADKTLERRQEIATDDPERKRPGAKILTGLNFGPEDGPEVQYLQKVFNYAPWKIGSRDKRPRLRAWENDKLRSALPHVVREVKKQVETSRDEWDSRSDKFKAEHTERMFVKQRGTIFLEAELKKARASIKSKRLAFMRGSKESIKWQMYTEKFRKLPPAVRDFAWTEWTKRNPDEKIDYMNADHITNLFVYGDTYWKEYSALPKKGRGLGVRP